MAENEVKSINGMPLADTTAREQVSQLSEEIATTHPTLTGAQMSKCKLFATYINNSVGKTESFVFFTDPHYAGSTAPIARTEAYLRQMAEVYYNTATSMCVSGGDWLNDSNTKENACWQLSYFDGLMKELFDKYIMVIGNHDTNYQGYEYMASGSDGTYDRDEHEKCILSANTQRNLWNRKYENSYFSFDGDCTKFYVFDTGLDWYPDMDEYRWGQVDWFANALLTDDSERSAAFMHIAGDSAETATPMLNAVTQIANAYNTRTSITLNDTTYDFTAVTGKFWFVMAGHKHADVSYAVNGIPVIVTINAFVDRETITFDLVLADYEANKIHMVRVGSGENRTITLTNADTGNLFTYGIKTDYNYQKQKVITEDVHNYFVVNASERYLQTPDQSGKSAVYFKNDHYVNDGSTFALKATFENLTEGNTATEYLFVRMFDADGNVYLESLDGFMGDYFDFVAAHLVKGADVTFVLPSEVATFQIGFLFDSVENNVDTIRISDISLTKVS